MYLPKLLAYEAETLLENTFGYVDYKYLINRKLKNAELCWVFANPVTNLQYKALKTLGFMLAYY